MKTMKVLCVEHQPRCLQALAELLEAVGYEVVTATTGGKALELIREQAVAGVLLEYDLPDATGVSIRAQMQRITPDIPILLFSGVGYQTPILVRFFDSYLRPSRSREHLPDTLAG